MKKVFFTFATVLLSFSLFAAAPDPEVSEKVLSAFEQSFKNASHVVWDQQGNHYEVKFVHNEIRSRITYDANGNILESMRYYGEEGLPLLVRSRLQERFAGKKVFGVTEVATPGSITYHVVLEDAKTWTNVACDSYGNTEIERKLRKATTN